ncbi:MAG: DUF2784 domain-containing protein [bacterium]|nr:DUF2784 domain-containing protein [bacterium]
MIAKVAADVLVLAHLGFILFVICGGFLALRWRWIVWLHLPCAAWGALIEFAGWICPLTPLENRLRIAAGSSGYESGFIDHYVMPLIYPAGLDRGIQIGLGVIVVSVNLVVYGVFLQGRKRG